MHVRKKTISGLVYCYLVKSVRTGRKVKQVLIAYLGPDAKGCDNIKVALTYWEKKLALAKPGKKRIMIRHKVTTLRSVVPK